MVGLPFLGSCIKTNCKSVLIPIYFSIYGILLSNNFFETCQSKIKVAVISVGIVSTLKKNLRSNQVHKYLRSFSLRSLEIKFKFSRKSWTP